MITNHGDTIATQIFSSAENFHQNIHDTMLNRHSGHGRYTTAITFSVIDCSAHVDTFMTNSILTMPYNNSVQVARETADNQVNQKHSVIVTNTLRMPVNLPEVVNKEHHSKN